VSINMPPHWELQRPTISVTGHYTAGMHDFGSKEALPKLLADTSGEPRSI
jgi:hypothetical protein